MTILAAIEEKERAERVVRIADDLAEAYDDTLVALHVVPTEEYNAYKESIEDISEFSDISVTQHEDSAKRFARKFVVETLGGIDEARIEPMGRVGDVTDEILAVAEDIEPRYLVIGGRRRSPTGKALFGSTTQQILLNADCPVVTKLGD